MRPKLGPANSILIGLGVAAFISSLLARPESPLRLAGSGYVGVLLVVRGLNPSLASKKILGLAAALEVILLFVNHTSNISPTVRVILACLVYALSIPVIFWHKSRAAEGPRGQTGRFP
jgi:hypothetical protein